MSLSKALKLTKELFAGEHLVAITNVTLHEEGIVIRFSDGQNKSFDKVYDFHSSEFLKMCYSAETINGNEIFDDKLALGKRLIITIAENWIDEDTVEFNITDTAKYEQHQIKPLEAVKVKKDTLPAEKKQVIAEAREMIKKVESGIKEVKPVNAIVESDEDIM